MSKALELDLASTRLTVPGYGFFHRIIGPGRERTGDAIYGPEIARDRPMFSIVLSQAT